MVGHCNESLAHSKRHFPSYQCIHVGVDVQGERYIQTRCYAPGILDLTRGHRVVVWDSSDAMLSSASTAEGMLVYFYGETWQDHCVLHATSSRPGLKAHFDPEPIDLPETPRRVPPRR